MNLDQNVSVQSSEFDKLADMIGNCNSCNDGSPDKRRDTDKDGPKVAPEIGEGLQLSIHVKGQEDCCSKRRSRVTAWKALKAVRSQKSVS